MRNLVNYVQEQSKGMFALIYVPSKTAGFGEMAPRDKVLRHLYGITCRPEGVARSRADT